MTRDAMVRVDRPVDDQEEDLLIVQRLDYYYICLIDTELEMSRINAQVNR